MLTLLNDHTLEAQYQAVRGRSAGMARLQPAAPAPCSAALPAHAEDQAGASADHTRTAPTSNGLSGADAQPPLRHAGNGACPNVWIATVRRMACPDYNT